MKSLCESHMNFPTVTRLVKPKGGISRKEISTPLGFSISGYRCGCDTHAGLPQDMESYLLEERLSGPNIQQMCECQSGSNPEYPTNL